MLTDRTVHDLRTIVTATLRITAAVAVGWGLVLVVRRLAFAVGSGSPTVAFRVWGDDLGERNSFYHGVGLFAAALLLAGLSGRVGRWVVPAPATGCPGCGHDADPHVPGANDGPNAPAATCPECGRPRR